MSIRTHQQQKDQKEQKRLVLQILKDTTHIWSPSGQQTSPPKEDTKKKK